MNLKIILLIMGMAFLIVPLGEARLGEFVTGDCVDIKTILNTTAVNLSTLSYPKNGSTIISNQIMERNGFTFNFTFCDTQVEGVYNYDYVNLEGNVFVNDFLVTPIGDTIDTGQSIIYVILLTFTLLFMSVFVWLAIITPYQNLSETSRRGTMIMKVTKTKYLKLISIWISYGLFLIFLMIMTGLTNNYINFEALTILISRIYTYLSFIGYGVTLAIIWILFLNLYKDILLNKNIKENGRAFLDEL